ncbi:MAG: Chaperone modulatory protein CbpM [Candidatus Erwinia impunctatus]|nr:Chaperone modulatory protein CbpM [Culicoides impunctatus]
MAEHLRFSVAELCQSVNISPEELQEVVGLGIIVPVETTTVALFDDRALFILRRARRLRIEFDLEWSGTALALTLLERVERLESENRQLKRQRDRWLLSD